MSFETISLLLNWVQLGVLLAMLSRLGRTFELIANTQRELRRAVNRLSEQRAAELSNSVAAPGIASAGRHRWAPPDSEDAMDSDDLAHLSP